MTSFYYSSWLSSVRDVTTSGYDLQGKNVVDGCINMNYQTQTSSGIVLFGTFIS